MVERLTMEREVPGSNLSRGTLSFNVEIEECVLGGLSLGLGGLMERSA